MGRIANPGLVVDITSGRPTIVAYILLHADGLFKHRPTFESDFSYRVD